MVDSLDFKSFLSSTYMQQEHIMQPCQGVLKVLIFYNCFKHGLIWTPIS